jgi:menaquinone-9 beta-reductase
MGSDTDVLIVGGGPAGLAAAIATREKGLRVIVADGARPPIGKACGEGLLPDALAAMGRLGVALKAADGCTLRGIRFVDGRACVSAVFRGGNGFGIRREILHQRLLERARESGVSFLWNTPITGLDEHGITAGRTKILTRWVIGADGSSSRVCRWTGLENGMSQKCRYAYRRHYGIRPWTDLTEIHWSEGAQAYVTPVGQREVCVVLISDRPNPRFDERLRMFPHLANQLEGAEHANSDRGAATGMFDLKRVYRGNVALVGDASGCVDAITGEGLSLSFRQATALAEALVDQDLERYQQAHCRMFRRPRLMGNLLLLLHRRNGVRRRAMKALEAAPHLFERMLAYHVGAIPSSPLAATAAQLGWRFLTA